MKSIVFKHRHLKRSEKKADPKEFRQYQQVTFQEQQKEAVQSEIHLDLDVPMSQPGGEEELEQIEEKEFKY